MRVAVGISCALHAGLALAPGFPDLPERRPGGMEVRFEVEASPAQSTVEEPEEVRPPTPEVPRAAMGEMEAPAVPRFGPVAPRPGTGEISGDPGTRDDARYRAPRLLVGALPLSAGDWEGDESGELEIPVRLKVGVDGRVLAVEPADPALARLLREAVERSAEAMRFVPAALDGAPVEAWFSMSFVFRRGS